MKLLKLLIILLFFQVFFVIDTNADNYPVQIIMESFAPYNYVKNGKVVGFATDIVRKIMRDVGVNYKITQYPDERLHAMLKSHKGIMAYVLFRTDEREKKFKWIGPIATDHVHLYKKKGNPFTVNNIEDVKNLNITSFRSGIIFDRLKELGFKKIDKSPTINSTFKKVLFGRINYMVGMPDLGVVHWLKCNGYKPDALEKTKVKIQTFDLYIVCTKDIPDSIVNKWQKSLDKLKASGEFYKTFNKYK